jgi:hypothetical protein
MKCSSAAFGEQNKTDNDSKCQQVYKSQKRYENVEKKCFFAQTFAGFKKKL